MDVPVAVFDLDKTLTVRDCVFPFMRKVGGTARIISVIVRHAPQVVRGVLTRDRDALKVLFVRGVFGGLSADDVDAQGVQFAHDVATSWIRADVAARLRWHQDQDHIVLLVSASLAPYAEPLGELLELDGVLCTRLESIDGVLTGELIGANCRGAEKVERIVEWCREAGVSIGSIEHAYGDSKGDLPMLAMATRGEMVTRMDLEASPA